MKHKKNIPYKNRRYYDFKKPSFPESVPPSEFFNAIKLERFTNKAGQNNMGYIIIVYIHSPFPKLALFFQLTAEIAEIAEMVIFLFPLRARRSLR